MAESKWKALKDIEDNYKKVKTALKQLFEFVIDDAYRTEARGMGQRGFGTLTPIQIMLSMICLGVIRVDTSPWLQCDTYR